MSELNNANYAFNNAIKLLNDNNVKESIEQLEEILKIQPGHKTSLNLLSDIYIKLNKPNESLNYLNEILKIDKTDKISLEKKYKILLYIGDESAAYEILLLMNESHPSINTARELSNYY